MDEVVLVPVEEQLDETIKKTMEEMEQWAPGCDERKALSEELNKLLSAHFEKEKLSLEKDARVRKKKSERREGIFRWIEIGGKVVALIGSVSFPMLMFVYAQKGNYMGADQDKSFGWLYANIGKIFDR